MKEAYSQELASFIFFRHAGLTKLAHHWDWKEIITRLFKWGKQILESCKSGRRLKELERQWQRLNDRIECLNDRFE